MLRTDLTTNGPLPVPAGSADAALVDAWHRTERPDGVVVVDEEPGIRGLLARCLRLRGYRVRTAGTAEEALAQMGEEPAAVALCDIRVPGRGGLWLLARIREAFPETAVVMATGAGDVSSAITSLRQGVVDYLTKPLSVERLLQAVRQAITWHVSASDMRRWTRQLQQEADDREAWLGAATRAITIDSDEAVDLLLLRLTLGDPVAYAHARRVSSLAVLLCDRLARPDAEKRVVRRAALLHDVGKSAIPDSIIGKPAPLTGEEYELVRTHPLRAQRMLSGVPFLQEAAGLVRAAHERPDGRGFPDGLYLPPLGARIIAIANAYDVMTNRRAYRPPIAPDAALAELERGAGAEFDPALVPLFAGLLRTR